MKPRISVIFCFLLISSFCSAQDTNVEFKVNLNGTIKPDSIYVFLYSTIDIGLDDRNPIPEKEFVFYELENTVQIYPGAYKIGIVAFGYKTLKTRLYIPPVPNYNILVNLNPVIIGWGGIQSIDQIKRVTLLGDFNKFEKKDEIPLVKVGNVWKLDKKKPVLKAGEKYVFYVNDQETVDLLNPKCIAFSDWIALKNIYTNNEIIFDPSLYSLVFNESELILKDSIKQNKFKHLIQEINALEKETSEVLRNARIKEKPNLLLDSILNNYQKLVKEYPEFSQIIIEQQLELLRFKLFSINMPRIERNDEDYEEKRKENCLNPELQSYFAEVYEKIGQLDPNSFLLTGKFIATVYILQGLIDECPELAETFNLEDKYFDNFLIDFTKKTANEKLACTILYRLAQLNILRNQDQSMEYLSKLKEHDFKKFITEEDIERLLAVVNINLGKIAPDFSINLLDGNSFTLSDYKGKFVFIDFWGSWCAPCRKEIPNLINLYNATDRDKLVIIGMAQDKEPDIRKYISENNIEYPNGLSSRELLAKYGIRKFPTSFLIDPNGIITRIDLRGESALNMMKNEIDNYFK